MRIFIAAGGSGGHIFPALEAARELKKNHHEVIFFTTPGLGFKKIEEAGFPVFVVSAKGVPFNSIEKFFVSVFFMMKALRESFFFLRHFRPDVVVGFGGYGAFPLVLTARILRCPALIHEQNVIPGRANLLLSKFVNKVAVSFEKSRRYFRPQKILLTGCPCRASLGQRLPKEEIAKKFQLSAKIPTILVFGGSQGSRRINEEFLKAARLLKEKIAFQTIHVTGESDYSFVKKEYDALKVLSYVSSFLDDMSEAYGAADVVISRAGAVTVSELVIFAIPCILIPYPFAGGHQKENAQVLFKAGLAKIVEDKDLSADRLQKEIEILLIDKHDKEKLKQNMRYLCFPDAARNLAYEITLLKNEK